MKSKLKNMLCVAFATAFAALPLTACKKDGGDSDAVKVFMPDGAPAIALAALMDSGFENTEFTVVAASTIGERVSLGDADMAIMPVNAAATLYNKGVGITMLSVNTHGNLYVVGDGDAIEPSDLVGKRLGVIGKDNVPDLTLKMIAGELDIELEESDSAVGGKIAVRYAADGPAIMPLIKQGVVDYALLADPAATNAVNNFDKSIVMDMQEQWRDVFGGAYPQACLVAKKSLVEESPQYVRDFLTALKASDGWAEQNPQKTVDTIMEHIRDAQPTLTSLTSEIVARCNIETVFAQDAREECETYFQKLTQLKTQLDKPVLAKVPDDGFYTAL